MAGAVLASVASAQQATFTSDGPATVVATQNGLYGSGANAITMFGAKVECQNATYTGHKVLTQAETSAGKKHELLPSGSTKVTITPHYGTCTGLGGLPATVDMNGCDYEFDLKETTAGQAHTYGATPTVECPAGKHIVVTLANAGGHSPVVCTLTVTEKTDYANSTLDEKDTTNGKLDATGTIDGIEVHKEGPALICNKSTSTTGVIHIDITISGRNEAGGATNISLSHP